MPPGKKSIFRQPGAQHFQLVHRSLRDPLINDPEASQRVFKPVERGNDAHKSGTTLADLEATLDKSVIRPNEGEATLYGITYDDSAYDYMAHLKPIGGGMDAGAESILIEGPKGSGVARGMKTSKKGKGKAIDDGIFNLLPPSVLPSIKELSQQEVYASQVAVPLELQGLQPDMDPHLRQVLEALEDDAFVDEDAEGDGWFEELLGEGERGDEKFEWEFREEGIDDYREEVRDDEGGVGEGVKEEMAERTETWQDRFKAFKEGLRGPQIAPSYAGDYEEKSEMADTVGSLVSHLGEMTVTGGKKRRGKRGPSDATGMSMSSSSMLRNTELRRLDDQFDRIEKDYDIDEEDEDDFPDDDDDNASIALSNMSAVSKFSLASHGPSSPPQVTREDFDAIMDDFLENYEVVGNKFRESLGGTALSGPEKLKVLREAIDGDEEGLGRVENRNRILELERMARLRSGKEEKERLPLMDVLGKKEDQWDVETILTTYTNTENHPAVIRSRSAAQAKARAAAQMTLVPPPRGVKGEEVKKEQEVEESDSGSETEREDSYRSTVSRPKGETKEERKARKASVKAERSARRAEKKHHKDTFTNERKRQLASHTKMVGNGRAADVAVSASGKVGVVSLS